MKKISVLMSTYNEPIDWIEKSINSILNQTYKNFEMIVVCDNPENNQLKDYLLKKGNDNEQLKIIINKKNKGLAESLNTALQVSCGDYIARMDADDIAFFNRLEYQLNFLENNPDIDFLSSNVHIINENDEIIKKAKKIQYSNEKLINILNIINVFVHPTFFVKREVFEKLSGYRIFPAAEDYDFVLRALDNNFKLFHLPTPLLYYRMRQNSMELGNALVSQICTDYIKELHIERIELGRDSYSLENLKRRIILDDMEKKKYSNILYNMKVKHRSKKFLIPGDIVIGMIRSKYFRHYFSNMMQIQIARRMYRD